MLFRVWKDVLTGLKTPVRALRVRHWVTALAYGVFALTVGLGSGLLHLESPSWFEVLVLPLPLVLYPCLVEEVIFRGLLLPRRLMSAAFPIQAAAATISTALFVAMHPLNAWLVGLSDTSQFLEPAFLMIVTALGYSCAYLHLSTGSLRAPIALHWITVVAWNLFLGREFVA